MTLTLEMLKNWTINTLDSWVLLFNDLLYVVIPGYFDS